MWRRMRASTFAASVACGPSNAATPSGVNICNSRCEYLQQVCHQQPNSSMVLAGGRMRPIRQSHTTYDRSKMATLR